tara:strand:- start:780 stop:1430 length:651 start_codon:yes stop_codon:yes gene_type:complete
MISNNLKKRFYTSLGLIALAFLIYNFTFFLVYFLIVLSVVATLEFMKLSQLILNNKLIISVTNLIFILYIFCFSLIFFIFSNFFELKIILYIILFGCIASDIGGYIFGKILKGPKLTSISPNKTYSGAVGSLVSSLVLVSSLFYYFMQIFNFKIIIVAATVSIFCQLGDLIFSFLKRKAKLKDTGNFLPGHGGVLDRLDGILFGIPAGFLFLTLLN